MEFAAVRPRCRLRTISWSSPPPLNEIRCRRSSLMKRRRSLLKEFAHRFADAYVYKSLSLANKAPRQVSFFIFLCFFWQFWFEFFPSQHMLINTHQKLIFKTYFTFFVIFRYLFSADFPPLYRFISPCFWVHEW